MQVTNVKCIWWTRRVGLVCLYPGNQTPYIVHERKSGQSTFMVISFWQCRRTAPFSTVGRRRVDEHLLHIERRRHPTFVGRVLDERSRSNAGALLAGPESRLCQSALMAVNSTSRSLLALTAGGEWPARSSNIISAGPTANASINDLRKLGLDRGQLSSLPSRRT